MPRFSIQKLLVGCIVAGSLLTATVGSAATIRIKDQATVSGTIIHLGDVADIADRDAKNREMLEKIELGPAPPTGSESRLDYAAIRSRLKSLGVDMSQLNFSGRSIVRVSRSGRTASQIQLTSFNPVRRNVKVSTWQQQRAEKLVSEAIAQFLRRRAPELGSVNVSVEIEPEDVADVMAAARGEYAIQQAKEPWLGTQNLVVAYLDQKENLHKAKVECTISRKPLVWAARYPLQRGQTIQLTDLVRKQVDEVGDGFTEIERLVGQEVSRPISRDTVLNSRDIRRKIVVRSNDLVRVTSRRGSLVITRVMKARKSGAVGDMISVVELNGRGELVVRVTDNSQAEVVTGEPNRLAILKDDTGTIEFRKSDQTKTPTRSAPVVTHATARNTSTEPEWRSLDRNATTRTGIRNNVTPAGYSRNATPREVRPLFSDR